MLGLRGGSPLPKIRISTVEPATAIGDIITGSLLIASKCNPKILSFMLARIPDPLCLKFNRIALLSYVAMTLASCATKEPPQLIADPGATRETALPWNEQQKWEVGGAAAEQLNTQGRR
jgi:hypothetical protein